MSRLNWSILLVFGLAILLWGSQKLVKPNIVPKQEKDELLVPDYVATNMQTTLYDKLGLARSFMAAEKMEHYEALAFTSFMQPRYTLHIENDPAPWKLTAKEATLYDENRLVFEEQVLLVSQDENGYLRKIATSYLEIMLDEQTMKTDQPLVISGVNFNVEGVGMNGNLRLKQINLLNHTKTTYRNES